MLRAELRRFLNDDGGAVSLEFLIWVPFFAFWIMGSIAWYDAYMSRNQAAKVAYTISDILSRQEEISSAFLFQVDALQSGLLTRSSGEGVLRISTIQRTPSGYDVGWSCANHPSAERLTSGNVPMEIIPRMSEGETVVLTELSVPWARFANYAGLGEQSWTFRVITRPRFTPQMSLVDGCA